MGPGAAREDRGVTSDRAIARLTTLAGGMQRHMRAAQAVAPDLPVEIRIEVNNIQECLDLLRHKLRLETLSRMVGPIDAIGRRCPNRRKAAARAARKMEEAAAS